MIRAQFMELMEDRLWRLVKALSLKHSLIGASRSSDDPSTIKTQNVSIDTQFLKLCYVSFIIIILIVNIHVYVKHHVHAIYRGWVQTPTPHPPYGNIIFLNLRSKNYRNMPPPRCKLKISLGLPLRLFFFGGGGVFARVVRNKNVSIP